MSRHGLTIERERLAAHVAERPSAAEARGWLEQLTMERIAAIERPLDGQWSGQRLSSIRCYVVDFSTMPMNVSKTPGWPIRS
ncbi:MAG: hypothetical protein MRJ92_01885 [Nitrospira sp.]|nr:hypothetical protein [Nitrospira sp.]